MKRLHPLLELIVLAIVFMAGIAPLVQMASAQTPWYVATNGTGDGTSWADATNSIQGAIDASSAGDTVWVSNGLYEAGGITNYPAGTVLTNRVAIYKAITVQAFSTNPADTLIEGDWDPTTTNGPAAVRCVWMTNGSTLIGFTLTNGATFTSGAFVERGGGVSCQSTITTISNCVLTGNSAGIYGGGAIWGTLYNCTIVGNSAGTGQGSGQGGGVYGGILFNCTLTGNSAGIYGGGARDGTLFNCMIVSNSVGSAGSGGGAYIATLTNCTIVGNSAKYGGGVYNSTLSNCTLTGNSSWNQGGGTYGGTLYNCTLTGNLVTVDGGSGAGALGGTLYNCTIVGNSANFKGGGTFGSILYNCTLTGNLTGGGGGAGALNSTLFNCTIVGNSASGGGGGVDGGTRYNCISWRNNRVDAGGTYNFSCGVGYTNGGSVSGNITNDPLFVANGNGYGTNHVAGNYRLRNESPPLNAGTNMLWMTNWWGRIDLDGSRRIDFFSRQVDMGCYELMPRGTMFIGH